MDNDNIFKQINNTLLSAGIDAMSIDKSAKILAVIYHGGDREEFTFNPKLKADLEWIQNRYCIYGSGIPDRNIVNLFKKYSKEIEILNDGGYSKFPEWAVEIFHDKYGIDLLSKENKNEHTNKN